MHDNNLDWLARNVHKWPENTPYVIPSGNELFERGAMFCEKHVVINRGGNCRPRIEFRSQWLARRAELQNKPSWESAPEWANYLAQDGAGITDGCWHWYKRTPDHLELSNVWLSTGLNKMASAGEVLGDWRGTLERRPEPGKQFTSIEDNQDGSMSNKTDWFERGELPPIGEVCEFDPGNGADNFSNDELKASGHSVQIVAHTKYNLSTGNVAVFKWDFDDCCGVSTGAASCFRPLPTERDKAISEMVAIMNGETACLVLFGDAAAKLYDAGYRRDPK